MLIAISKCEPASPEEVEMTSSLLSDGATQEHGSPWFGQPFRMRGILRDGTQFALALSLTECAELFMQFNRDATVRDWADMMETRLAQQDPTREH